MASIRKEIVVKAGAARVWAAVRDFGAVHRRLAPGFVVDARLDGAARIVTFANGLVARELLVGIDDASRRLAYAIVDGRATHYNGAMQVLAEGADRCRLVWIVDLLPDELAPAVSGLMDQGAASARRTLESVAAAD